MIWIPLTGRILWKEQQRNWIGRSEGAQLEFKVMNSTKSFEVFTTRPDTIFGVSFMTLAPEHALVNEIHNGGTKICSSKLCWGSKKSQRSRKDDRSETYFRSVHRELMRNILSQKKTIPIWIGDYVLAGYGTEQWWLFPDMMNVIMLLQTFSLPILRLWKLLQVLISWNNPLMQKKEMHQFRFSEWSWSKEGNSQNDRRNWKERHRFRQSEFQTERCNFGRQRYWGEPIPIYYKTSGFLILWKKKDLPLVLPEVDAYLRLKMENHHWQEQDNGNTKDSTTMNLLPCRDGLVLHGISCVIWTHTTTLGICFQRSIELLAGCWSVYGWSWACNRSPSLCSFLDKVSLWFRFYPVQEPAKTDQSGNDSGPV